MPEETTIDQNSNPNPGCESNNITSQDPEWLAGVDPTLITDKVRGFKDLNGLINSYNQAQSFIGKGIPDENTPVDIRDAFFTKLGRPVSADKYDWQPPEGLTVDGATAENFKAFKQKCFEAGMTNKQVSTVMDGWSQIVIKLIAESQDARASIAKESKAMLSAQNEWGDKYDSKLEGVLKRIDELGVRQQLDAAGVLYDARVLKAFDSVISDMRETKIRGADGKYISPNERISQLRNNPAYFNAAHPDHAAVIAEVNSLYAKMATQ